ncbi:hypothetical protein [Helicobacter marmotae]|uniref:Transformation system protein n=1 Tax=Helicobacter marmotae TaxID=152490 RepID=A0A3D8I4J3_9HELI|nr:hypothetical protein [Helicobacter marmotae]RDU59461.1 hypothetical protein CQA63_06810 [Helicobacter marmotae]
MRICLYLCLLALSLYANQAQALITHLQAFSKSQSLEVLQNMSNPFKQIHAQKPLEIRAIINGKVLINEEWFSKGDGIQNYVIADIRAKHIILKKGKAYYNVFVGEIKNQD